MATQCPIAREDFLAHAEKLQFSIGEKTYDAEPSEFRSDSFGWKLNEKGWVTVNGIRCKVQIGINITVVGSKNVE